MPFIGNQPALSYTSFAKQDFTTSATTSYVLDNPVANANELALFINFVRQEPTTAYSASGTSLTLTSATSASDDMYCVFLGKAVQTVNPPNGSVGTAQLASSLDLSNKTVTLASNMTNAPAFEAHLSSSQSLTDVTLTKVEFDNEIFDTDNAYDNSTNYRFTPQVAGKYFVYGDINADPVGTAGLVNASIYIFKNGVGIRNHEINFNNNYARRFNLSINCVIDMNGSSDYLEIFTVVNDSSGNPQLNATTLINNLFGAYKLIGI